MNLHYEVYFAIISVDNIHRYSISNLKVLIDK